MNNIRINNIIRRKDNFLAAILLGMILPAGLSSCEDRFPYENGVYEIIDGEEVTVPISLSVLPIESDPGSRAETTYLEPSDDEKRIHDFWVIEYHENGTRAGLPRYYVEDENGKLPKNINIIVPRRDQDEYTCVLIANSNDPALFNANNRSKFSTLDSLRTFELSTHNHEHVFDPSVDKYLLMSGWTTITTDPKTHNLSFLLMRNVCKVHVTLLDGFPEDKLVYEYFQWRDVPVGKGAGQI